MCGQQAAKRRRAQAKNGYAHLAERDRPNYAKRSKETLDKRRASAMATEQRMKQGKKK